MDPNAPNPSTGLPDAPPLAKSPERPSPPRFRIFSPEAVGAATFIGGPVAGGVTMLVNDVKTGNSGRGVAWMVGAIVLTGGLIGLATNVDLGAVSLIGIGIALGARALAGKVFDGELAALQAAEIKPRGLGAGVLVGLPCFVGILVLAFGFGLAGHEGDKEQFGMMGVYVRDGATVAEAEAVADFFDGEFDSEVDVYIDREEDAFVVGMVMNEGWYADEERAQLGVRIANRISAIILDGEATVFGAADDQFKIQERYASDGRLGRALAWGDDDMVFGRTGVTDEQLEAARAALDVSEWVAEDGVAIIVYPDAAGNLRACPMILEANLEMPGLGQTVSVMVGGIPGVKGADICNLDGDVVRAAE